MQLSETLKNYNTGMLSLYLSKELNALTFCLTHNSIGGSSEMHQNREIDMKTFNKSISMLRDNSRGNGLIVIGFYNKEPLLELGVIQEIVDYCNENLAESKINYVIHTSLELLTYEILGILEKEKFQLLIDLSLSSLEGLHSLDNNVINDLLKIKREYRGLYNNISINIVKDLDVNYREYKDNKLKNHPILNNIKVMTTLDKDSYNGDTYNNFLNNIRKMYSDNNRSVSPCCSNRYREYLNGHRRPNSIRNKVNIIEPYIWDMQEFIGNKNMDI